jgi:hypothetical protein
MVMKTPKSWCLVIEMLRGERNYNELHNPNPNAWLISQSFRRRIINDCLGQVCIGMVRTQ